MTEIIKKLNELIEYAQTKRDEPFVSRENPAYWRGVCAGLQNAITIIEERNDA